MNVINWNVKMRNDHLMEPLSSEVNQKLAVGRNIQTVCYARWTGLDKSSSEHAWTNLGVEEQ